MFIGKDWCWSWGSNTLAFIHGKNHSWKEWFIGKDPDAGKDWGQEEKGTTEDEMVGWHHRLNGYEFEQSQEESDGRLECCSSWGRRVRHDLTELQQQDFLKKYFKIITSLFCLTPTFLAFFQLLVVTVLSLAKRFLWLATFSFCFC